MTALTPTQRHHALAELVTLEAILGVPEAIYIAEDGVTIIANTITARRWAGHGDLHVGPLHVPVLVLEALPLGVAS